MPELPDGLRVYAIGDIHGRADLLMALLGRIEQHAEALPHSGQNRLIFLGDYVDRGPDSCDVLDILSNGLPDGFETDLLMGNHEQMMLDAFEDSDKALLWLLNGGEKTIQSFRDSGGEDGAMPARHMPLMESLQLQVGYGDYHFVHAGIRPGVLLEAQTRADLLWIREPFLGHTDPFPKLIVHGHTPGEEPVVRANRLGLDTGAWMTGRLTAAVLEGAAMQLIDVRKP